MNPGNDSPSCQRPRTLDAAEHRVAVADRLHGTTRFYGEIDRRIRKADAQIAQHQYELHLPARPTDEVLTERLAGLVEFANSRTDLEPGRIIEIKHEIDSLRAILKGGRT